MKLNRKTATKVGDVQLYNENNTVSVQLYIDYLNSLPNLVYLLEWTFDRERI